VVNVVNSRQFCHLVNSQQVEVPQQAKHERRKRTTHDQRQRDGCTEQ
jgi:hypothetical protein